jgi:outer membrane biosynthesis protein TonB
MKRPLESELPSELRAELMRSRRAGHDYDAVAKLPQLRAALEAAAHAPVDGSSVPHGSSSGALHVTPAAWKLVLLVATVGATAFGAWSLQTGQRPAQAPPSITAQPVAPPAPAPSVVQKPEPTPVHSTQPAPAVEAAAPQSQPSPEPAASSSRREIAQLVRIRALIERDPAAAYRLAQQSDREFPNGVLSEERQALQLIALAKSGSTDAAQRKANAFYARYPQSPMRELIDAALHR